MIKVIIHVTYCKNKLLNKLAYNENESYYFIIMLALLLLLTFDKLSKTPISSFIDKSKKNCSGKTALQVEPSKQ